MGNLLSISFGQRLCIGKPQEHQLMADKLNFAVLNGQSMRRSTGGPAAKLRSDFENYVKIKFKN